MIQHDDRRYGPESIDRLAETGDPSADGARAALESFYFALNGRNGTVLRRVWADEPLAQLNNPVGGIVRGGTEVADFYDRVFAGPVRLSITFGDIVEYLGDRHAVFAGRETGTYTDADGTPADVGIRTSRYFRYHDGRWSQFHHHGSIDDPRELAAYQRAVARQGQDRTRPGSRRDRRRSASAASDDVLTVDRRFFDALLDRDDTALNRLLDPQFVIVDVEAGDVTARDELVALVAAGQVTFERIDIFPEETLVRRLGNCAVVVGRTAMRFTTPGGSGSTGAESRYTHVFTPDADGRWRLASAQGTVIRGR